MTEWITHKSKEPPLLAPAALVQWIRWWNAPKHNHSGVARVDQIRWCRDLGYRPRTDDKGHKLISAEGLEKWAEWVRTDEDGTVIQWGDARDFQIHYPERWLADQRFNPLWLKGPETHRHPGDYRDSLYRVEGR